MKKVIAFIVGILIACSVNAQTIHHYPYDPTVTAYNATLTPPLLSAQCHWRPANSIVDNTTVPQLMSPSIGHTHVEVNAPIYGEFSNNFTVPFDIILFHVDGHIHPSYPLTGVLLGQITWDTPDGSQPVMNGDPNGMMKWSGHVTIDFSKATGDGLQKHDIPENGWFTVQFQTMTVFTNGDITTTSLNVPFYSVRNTSVPEVFMPQDGGATGTECTPTSSRDPRPPFLGTQIVEYRNYLPLLAPLTATVDPTLTLYNYTTSDGLPLGVGATRRDMDLHNGNPGILLESKVGGSSPQMAEMTTPFNPTLLGAGTHKVAAIWEQDTGNGSFGLSANEQSNALLVVSVTVGGVIPPPVITWSTWILQHQDGSTNILRACPDMTGTGCIPVP